MQGYGSGRRMPMKRAILEVKWLSCRRRHDAIESNFLAPAGAAPAGEPVGLAEEHTIVTCARLVVLVVHWGQHLLHYSLHRDSDETLQHGL